MNVGACDALHLKSVITALDETTLLAAANATGRSIQAQVCSRPYLAERFRVVEVPDPLCSNVLRIGRTVAMQQG